VDVDERGESVGRKIRDGELRKVPYLLIVGDREAESGEVAVRRHGDGDQGAVPAGAFAAMITAKVAERA
jgi:threonyl-tRNA synthetase